MNNDFVRFYSEWEARNEDIHADQILELNLSRINLAQPNEEKSTREVSKQVVTKEIVHKPDSITKEYATVKAFITTTKRLLRSQADLYITLRDAKGRIIWNDRFTGEHRWQTEILSYTGDERALTDSDKNLLNKTQQNPPTEDVVMGELLGEIQNDLSRRLRSYYSRF